MKKVLMVTAMSTLLLSGCGLFKKSEPAWKSARQERPLEIPQGLDRPDVSDALVIPRVNEHPTDTVSGSTDSLHVSDPVGRAYERVGKVLEDAQVGVVVSQDGSSHTYRVDTGAQSKALASKKKGFFSRLFGRDQETPATQDLSMPHLGGEVTVRVKAAADGGSTVGLEGDGSDVARVAAALRAQLGG